MFESYALIYAFLLFLGALLVGVVLLRPNIQLGKQSVAPVLLIILNAICLVMLFQMDSLINGTLYNYGLIFSFDWAETYWLVARGLMAFCSLNIALGVVLLVKPVQPTVTKPIAQVQPSTAGDEYVVFDREPIPVSQEKQTKKEKAAELPPLLEETWKHEENKDK